MTNQPTPQARLAMDLPEEFMNDIYFEPMSGCWLWGGTLNYKGYGRYWNGRQTLQAHRFIFEATHGPIPSGLQIDHVCRVRNCVNPDHLRAVTPKENTLCGTSFAAVNARKTVCPTCQTPYTHHANPKWGRWCKPCSYRSARRRHAAKRLLEKGSK